MAATKKIFVTYARDDRDLAEWVAKTLQDAGHTIVIQAWDFKAGENFIKKMDQALVDCDHTIGIFSPAYLKSVYANAEWTAAYKQMLMGEKSRGYIPVKVVKCDPVGLLGPIVSIDLFDVDEDEARLLLLEGVQGQVPRVPRNPGSMPFSLI
jgi:hypothetical protein